eukprot:scaffold139224_cov93-Phaeocystis_antarctica.AAC.2
MNLPSPPRRALPPTRMYHAGFLLTTYCLPVGRGRCTTRVRAPCTARRRSVLEASSLPVARAHAVARQSRRMTPGAV